MTNKLNPQQEQTAKAWLHDIFVLGGAISQPKRPIPAGAYKEMYGPKNSKVSTKCWLVQNFLSITFMLL